MSITPAATPTPMPILAPVLSPELELSEGEGVLLLSVPVPLDVEEPGPV